MESTTGRLARVSYLIANLEKMLLLGKAIVTLPHYHDSAKKNADIREDWEMFRVKCLESIWEPSAEDIAIIAPMAQSYKLTLLWDKTDRRTEGPKVLTDVFLDDAEDLPSYLKCPELKSVMFVMSDVSVHSERFPYSYTQRKLLSPELLERSITALRELRSTGVTRLTMTDPALHGLGPHLYALGKYLHTERAGPVLYALRQAEDL